MLSMPVLKLETTVVLSEDKRKALLASLSKAVAGTIGKPEQYVMVTVGQAAILMSGKAGDGAFVDIRSIGGVTDEVIRPLYSLRPVNIPGYGWMIRFDAYAETLNRLLTVIEDAQEKFAILRDAAKAAG